MSVLENFLSCLQYYLSENDCEKCSIIRKHSKKLEKLGDVSFPLKISNWCQLIERGHVSEHGVILDYKKEPSNLETRLKDLKNRSENWPLEIEKIVISNNNANLFLKRTPLLFLTILQAVLEEDKYGSRLALSSAVTIKSDVLKVTENDLENQDLSTLRLFILAKVTLNLLKFVSVKESSCKSEVILSLKYVDDNDKTNILCGPVLNDKGLKSDVSISSLYSKRASDMRMMAQHKYGVRFQFNSSWKTYFEKLGRDSTTIELLSNKPQKPIKITLSDLQTANRGSSFLFYNCARINALYKEFNKRVSERIYPELPKIEGIDFSQLNQPEEWELFYAYIMQYPVLVNSCVKDIENGILNVHNLVTFLLNLSSVFSGYYRRVKILTDSREHLFPVLHARIYLLKGIRYIFHNALSLMDIEPITKM